MVGSSASCVWMCSSLRVFSLAIRQLCHGRGWVCLDVSKNTLHGVAVQLYLVGVNKGDGLAVVSDGYITARFDRSKIRITVFSLMGSSSDSMRCVWRTSLAV